MTPASLKGQIEEWLARSGRTLAALTPAAGLDLILGIFRDHPEIGDLACTWGRVTRYGPDEDGFQIRCWFADSEPAYPTLVLAFKVGPADAAGNFPWWEAGCASPDGIEACRASVAGSPAGRRWGQSRAAAATLYVDDLDYHHALFDCWGACDPARRVVSMTAADWASSADVGRMLRWFRQEWRGEEAELNRLLRGYCLACCRRIWPLLPLKDSRAGVEVAERHLRGEVTRDEYHRAEWDAEGAAFTFDMPAAGDGPEVRAAIDAVARLAPAELAAFLHAPRPEDDLSPRGVLAHAAYFADVAMCYPLRPAESIERYSLFLSAPLLREVVGSPPRFGPGDDPS